MKRAMEDVAIVEMSHVVLQVESDGTAGIISHHCNGLQAQQWAEVCRAKSKDFKFEVTAINELHGESVRRRQFERAVGNKK